MHRCGLWINKEDATLIANAGMTFLQGYAKLAGIAHRNRELLWPLFPKMHFCWHIYHQLRWESSVCEWAMSPLATSVPMDEDFVGRFARLTRRVHAMSTIPSAMSRYKIYALREMEEEV